MKMINSSYSMLRAAAVLITAPLLQSRSHSFGMFKQIGLEQGWLSQLVQNLISGCEYNQI